MTSSDESLPIRKALSADNSKDVSELSSESGSSNEINIKSHKSASSASCESARGKQSKDRQVQNFLTEEFDLKYLRLHEREDQKLFLNGSQILEKLNKIIARNTLLSSASAKKAVLELDSSVQKKLSLREIMLYQDVLKRLLEERCSLVLKEECDLCVKRTIKLIKDFKHLYFKEKLKMSTMPLQACNRFISSSDISISTLELLVKKLQIMCDLHLSISSSYQKIINCFHVGLDLELYQSVMKTNRVLYEYRITLFHWAYKTVSIFMQKLCLADPNSISPDFLQSILDSSQNFNVLLRKNSTLHQSPVKLYDLFYKDSQPSQYKEISCNLILNFLAFFEAKVASEKIVSYLTSTCRRNRISGIKRKKATNQEQNANSVTSDYCSASVSDWDSENPSQKTHSINTNSNFGNILSSITQRNQSLVLKYLYAMSNLHNGSNKNKRKSSYDNIPARQMWSLPEQSAKSDNYTYLEEAYWTRFWSVVQRCILKLLFDVPYHQYGDAVAGTILLWPDIYVQTLSESLKFNLENNDITIEVKGITKQVLEYVMIYRKQLLWDKNFSAALSSIHLHQCTPVPTASNHIKTQPGNLLHSCIDLMLKACDVDSQEIDSTLHLQCLHQLQSTLDCFILWVNNKGRTLLSSQNWPTFLLISSSDCGSAVKLLKSKPIAMTLTENFSQTYIRVPPVKLQSEKVILMQIDILSGYEAEVSTRMYKFFFSAIKEAVLFALKYERSLKSCSLCKAQGFSLDTQEELIYPLTEIINRLPNNVPVVKAFTTAVTQAFLSALHNFKQNLSKKHIQFLNAELSKYLQWVDKLELSGAGKTEVKRLQSLQKLECILECIQKSATRRKPCIKRRNRILPLDASNGSVLSEQETQYWQRMNGGGIFSCCCTKS